MFYIKLKSYDSGNKIGLLRELRNLGWDLSEITERLDSLPLLIVETQTEAEALTIQESLALLNASVSIEERKDRMTAVHVDEVGLARVERARIHNGAKIIFAGQYPDHISHGVSIYVVQGMATVTCLCSELEIELEADKCLQTALNQ